MEFIIGLVILAIDIYAIYHILTSGASTVAKVLWTLGVIVFPVIGAAVWFFMGPRGGGRARAGV